MKSLTRYTGSLGLTVALVLLGTACRRHSSPPPPRAEQTRTTPSTTPRANGAGPIAVARKARATPNKSREVYAAWYKVPPDSLAKRRAGIDELTAAHNHLPIGTLVRISNIHDDRSVTLRITDRGITNRRAKIDICKEAAEQLGIVGQGITRVRMEILPDPPLPSASAPERAASH